MPPATISDLRENSAVGKKLFWGVPKQKGRREAGLFLSQSTRGQ
jgi:hypothetical protein